MIFNQKALTAKNLHLDEIKKYPEIIERVIKRNISDDYVLTERTRFWIGGGGTSYVITTIFGKIFLKIKHREVTVESKLEEEKFFIDEPCIEHEKRMLELASKAGVSVPRIIFYDEESDFQFLATEYIEDSFEDVIQLMTIEEILYLWHDLYRNIELLFKAGLVHSDIHELNLRCRDKKIFLIDLEETRELVQNCCFEESLDYVGRNKESSLGNFPLSGQQNYSVHTNSLSRMNQVFKNYLIPKVIEFIKECNYDSSNGICVALDHGKSENTYQSINNEWISIKGQREQKDKRPELIYKLFKRLNIDCDYVFVDVGSNNGLFCRVISKYTKGKIRTIGLEGFHKFNILANALSFLEDCKNTEYYDFLCGKDDIIKLGICGKCFMSFCSVWHHIQKKDEFLKQLNALDLRYIFLEMPVQTECYNRHTWKDEVCLIKEELEFKDEILLGYSHDYNRPLILLSKEKIADKVRNKIKRDARRVLVPTLLDRIILRILWSSNR